MSAKYKTVKNYFDLGVWSEARVRQAVIKAWITEEEFKLITGKNY